MTSQPKGHYVLSKIALIVADVVSVNVAYLLAILLRFYVRFEFNNGAAQYMPIFWKTVPLYAIACVAVFYFFHLYNSVWEYAGFKEMKEILAATGVTAVLQVLLSRIWGNMPLSYYFIGPFIQVFFTLSIRFGYKIYLMERNHSNVKNTMGNVLIIGVDGIAQFAKRQIEDNGVHKIVGFVDNNGAEAKRVINGIPVVVGTEQFGQTLDKLKVTFVIIADKNLSSTKASQIKAICRDKGIEVQNFIEYLQNNNTNVVPVTIDSAHDGARIIPFSPPDISDSEIEEVKNALQSGWITTGPRTKELEKRLAKFCHTSKVVCLNSATAAEELNFRVCGIGEGDEVVVA